MKILDLQDQSQPIQGEQAKLIHTLLDKGRIIVYPTDTLYGLGVDASSESAVNHLNLVKNRDQSPISVLLESVDQLLDMATELNDTAQTLIKTFLPGALTVICRSDYSFAPSLRSAADTIGFRVPGDKVSKKIPEILGRPITTTSVNPAGQTPANSRSEVAAYFKDQVDLMLDVGPIPRSKGSTVIDISQQPFKILREGEISRQALKDFLN